MDDIHQSKMKREKLGVRGEPSLTVDDPEVSKDIPNFEKKILIQYNAGSPSRSIPSDGTAGGTGERNTNGDVYQSISDTATV